MLEKDWKNIKEIFLEASERSSDERAAFIAGRCGMDKKLLNEVESLIAAHESDVKFIETPAIDLTSVLLTESNKGKKIGKYKIVKEIGRGGMGAVFLAMRDDGEFEQQVAIKIIRQTIAENEIIKHFKRERQILAKLNHPNIAKLLDGGISVDGLPFLAMEFVEGETIAKFVEQENLNLEERLKLFLKVCSAVQYAHQNLTVHRDIKPSNIIVSKDFEPKLLDFGLAKLINENLSGDIEQTQTDFRALTPVYASPEQLKNEPITTTSDIYSLGIVLYELLTGERPFHFEGKSLDEIIKNATEAEPPLPSANPKSKIQNSKFKVDLDNIVLMALRKEPERRYQSVEVFADDIKRYLKGLPVSARPNTFKYRASKFIKRNKVAVLAASLIFLSLVGGIFISIWQARIAQREKLKAQVINAFFQTMLTYSDNSSNLSRPKGNQMTVTDVLDEASKKLEMTDLSNQLEVKAELLRIIGSSYLTQGNYEAATKQLRSALELQIQIYGKESPEVLLTYVELGQIFVSTADYSNAEQVYQQRLAILRAANQKKTINPVYLLVALNDYAVLQRAQGDSQEAKILLLEALALKSQILPENRIALGIVESVYALTLSDEGKFDEAESILRARIAEIRQLSNDETLDLASNLNGLSNILMEKGNLDEALQNLFESERIYRKLANKSFLPLGDNLRYQAQVFYLQGNYVEAEKKINETLEIYTNNARPQFINYPTALTIQGLIFNKTNRPIKAEKILRQASELREQNLPKEHYLTALTQGALGECLTAEKKYDEAEILLRKSFESLKLSQGETNPRTIMAKNRLQQLSQHNTSFELKK